MLSVVSPPYGLFHCALSPAAGSDIPSGNFQRGHDEDLPSRHLKWSRPDRTGQGTPCYWGRSVTDLVRFSSA